MTSAMRRIAKVAMIIVALHSPAAGQEGAPTLLYARVGAAFPQGPQAFSDYWNFGPSAGIGIVQPFGSGVRWRMFVDYGRFMLNKEQFYKGLEVSEATSSISGGNTTIFAASGTFQILVPSESETRLFFSGGGAYLLTTIGEAFARYSGIEMHQPKVTYGSLSLSLGAGYTSPISTTMSLSFEFNYYLGIAQNEKANSDFFSLSVGVGLIYAQ